MPGENYTFTTHVDPGSPPQLGPPAQRVVEAPGTAPRVRNDYSEQRLSP